MSLKSSDMIGLGVNLLIVGMPGLTGLGLYLLTAREGVPLDPLIVFLFRFSSVAVPCCALAWFVRIVRRNRREKWERELKVGEE